MSSDLRTPTYEVRHGKRGSWGVYVRGADTPRAALARAWQRDLDRAYELTWHSLAGVCQFVRMARHSTTTLSSQHALPAPYRGRRPGPNAWRIVPCTYAQHMVLVALRTDETGATRAFYLDANPVDTNGILPLARAAFGAFDLSFLLPGTYPHTEVLRWHQSQGVCMAITYYFGLVLILNPRWSADALRRHLRGRTLQWGASSPGALTQSLLFLKASRSRTRTSVAGLPLLAPQGVDVQSVCDAVRTVPTTPAGVEHLNGVLRRTFAQLSYEQYNACPDALSKYIRLDSVPKLRDLTTTPGAQEARNASFSNVWPHYLEAQIMIFLGFVADLAPRISSRS
jgi:hypothetical protein